MPGQKRKRTSLRPGIVQVKVPKPLLSATRFQTLYQEVSSRTKVEHTGPIPMISSPSTDTVEHPSTQGASSKKEPFTLEVLKEIQDEILSLEFDETVDKPCPSCTNLSHTEVDIDLARSERRAIYRCLECFTHKPMCSDCIIKCHRDQPFHHIQKWTGCFFEKAALSDLGLVLYLGHQGDRCPGNPDNPSNFVVVHTNRIHNCKLLYCRCKCFLHRQDKTLQLVRHQLFPPTIDHPQSGFTFAVLDDFDRHSLNAKSSNYDYCKALSDYTDAAFPTYHRYKEFKLIMRLWCYLMLRRRSGQDFNIDTALSHRRRGCLALRCPACPEVGFNVEEEVVDLAQDNDSHKYTFFASADGNFRLQRKKKNHDKLDKSLNAGNGYFVEESKYQNYVQSLRNEVDTSLCAKLKAVRQQDRSKFKDAEVSGVVAIQCAWHGFYLPQGMVDLDKGEAYIKTDYALMHALGPEGLKQRWISVSYDIWCQYHINLKKRVTANLPHFKPLLDHIHGSVPKMHINGHNVDCQIMHSFVYEPHSGMTHGEAIESTWSEQNHAASFTKEQNPGHQQETLDSFNGHYNFCKLRQLSSDLSRRRRRAEESHAAKKDAFAALTSSISPELVASWRAREAQSSKFELYQVQNKMPIQQPTTLASYQKEREAGAARLIEFVRRGLEIETLQTTLRQAEVSNENIDCNHLVDLLKSWRADQCRLFPLLKHHSGVADGAPETTNLLLPSSFPSSERDIYGLEKATEIETALRRDHAFDVLSNLKETIHELNHTLTEKRKNPSSQRIATRSQKIVSEICSRMLNHKEEYCRCYKILEVLGPKATEGFQPLEADQLWGKNVFIPHTTGDSSRQNPWFWSVGRPESMPSSDLSIELERVRWYREKAAVERLSEELEILEEEFRRTHTSFVRMTEVWRHLADLNGSLRGYSAYARRQADMYSRYATECLSLWKL